MNNGSSGTINIHGREYKTVALRVQEFRTTHPATDGWSILSEIVEMTDEKVVMRATIFHNEKPVAMGYAEEYRSSSKINATSALENCETSAIGRALANFGIGGSEYASANEVVSATKEQSEHYERLLAHNAAAQKWTVSIVAIKDGIHAGDLEQACEAWDEIPEEDKRALWLAPSKGGIFSTKEREIMKSDEWAEIRRSRIEEATA